MRSNSISRWKASSPERGGAMWAFVITLLALFVFAYLWFDVSDQRDKAQEAAKKAEETARQNSQAADEYANRLQVLSQLVGYPMGASGGGEAIVQTDPEALKKQLEPEGIITSGEQSTPGMMNWLTNNALIKIERNAVSKTDDPQPVQYEWVQVTPEFESALAELKDLTPPSMPPMPHDWDDDEVRKRYQEAKANYEQEWDEYHEKFVALSEMEGFKEWSASVVGPGGLDFSKDMVQVVWAPKLESLTVEDLLTKLKGVIGNIIKTAKDAHGRYQGEIKTLTDNNKAKDGEIEAAKKALETEQTDHQTTRNTLESQIQQLQNELEAMRVKALQSRQALDEERQRRTTEVGKLNRDLESRKEALRIFKQKRDLVVRRDDPDGKILAASQTMNTAMIDLGTADKVFVGLKFQVSALDRVGARTPKGEIMVTKVTGRHSASCRIVSRVAPITAGDIIHNPFYSAKDSIHIWFAGNVSKWPREVAEARLGEMGVTLQRSPNGKTDYIVVPNSWVLEKESTGDDEEADEDEGASSDPMARIRSLARENGATIITESLLDAFLDY